LFTLKHIQRVLVVCGANACRSPMAEAALQEVLDRRFRMDTGMPVFVVSSAGLADGDPSIPDNETDLRMAPHAMTLMDRYYRVDLSERRSRPVWTLPKEERAGIIVAISPKIAAVLREELPKPDAWDLSPPRKSPHILVMNEASGGVPDPYYGYGDLTDYQLCLFRIQAALPDIAEKIGEIVRKENREREMSFLSMHG